MRNFIWGKTTTISITFVLALLVGQAANVNAAGLNAAKATGANSALLNQAMAALEKTNSGANVSINSVVLDDVIYFADEQGVVWAESPTGELTQLYVVPEDIFYGSDAVETFSVESLYVENGGLYLVLKSYYYEQFYNNLTYSLLLLDTTAGGASVVEDPHYPYGDPAQGYPDINDLIYQYAFNNKNYYVFETDDSGQELWQLLGEGSNRRFALLADIMPGAQSSSPANFHIFNERLYFTAAGPQAGREIWAMDASENITQVADINPDGDSFVDPGGPSAQYSNHRADIFFEYQGALYFVADHIDYGHELWRTDGTSAGTQLVLDAFPGAAGIMPFVKFGTEFIKFEGVVDDDGFYYQIREDDNETVSLWVSDGTAQGTKRAAATGEGVMGDLVWLDSNGNGIQDTNESGLADVFVELYECDGYAVTSTRTNAQGAFLFDQVPPGNYQIFYKLPNGYKYSPRAAGNYAVDSNVFPETGLTRCLSMEAGQIRRALDAGMVPVGATESVTILQAIYFSAENKLWVRAESDVTPVGSAKITLSAQFGSDTLELGDLLWRTYKSYYQNRFDNLPGIPDSVTLVTDSGDQVTGVVRVQ